MTQEEVVSERNKELREWLEHLDGWVDGRLAATQDLMTLVIRGREPRRAARRR